MHSKTSEGLTKENESWIKPEALKINGRQEDVKAGSRSCLLGLKNSLI